MDKSPCLLARVLRIDYKEKQSRCWEMVGKQLPSLCSMSWKSFSPARALQYSGLEKSMDCIVHGVVKSRTRLSDFHFQCKESPFEKGRTQKE